MTHRVIRAVVLATAVAGPALAMSAKATFNAAPAPAPAVPTFSADVAPIIHANCTTCHRPGQTAPFPLISYDDVKKHGQTIVDVTARRYMPPWHASHADGFPEFMDERRLSDANLDTLKRWVDGGMPIGDAKKIPLPPVFPAGWSLGAPDLIVGIPKAIPVPAEAADIYRNVVIPVDLPDDKWITAVDFQPTARTVVHHALYFLAPAGAEIGEDEVLPGAATVARGAIGGAAAGRGRGGIAANVGDASSGLGGWVPGMTPRFFPDGIAQPLTKHSNIVVQLHLHPSGKAEQVEGQLALYFAKSAPAHSLASVQVPPVFGYAAGIDIAAGRKDFRIVDTFELPVGVQAYGTRGHAHYLARSMKMTAVLPDGTTKGLLWIKDWDFGWQDSYFYKTPFTLPAHTKITTEIVYDNSDSNPRNPHTPAERVRWGRGSFDEMGSMSLIVASPPGADGDTLKAAVAQHFREQLLKMYTGRGGND